MSAPPVDILVLSAGTLSFVEPPGSFDICGVCFWEDDVVQLKNPYLHTGANRMSLIEAQKNFLEFGAMSRDALEYVQASPDGERDPGWRPFDPAVDDPDGGLERAYSDATDPYYWWHGSDPDLIYWWRPTFWRRNLSEYAPKRPELLAALAD